MSKIDEIKELLTTLRVLFSIGVGLIVALSGVVSSAIDAEVYGYKFYLSIVAINILTLFILIVLKEIFQKTKELRSM